MTRWQVFVWFILPAGVLAATTVTVICALKMKRGWTLTGLAAAAAAIWLMIWSWDASPEAFEDVGIFVLFQFLVVPLLLLTSIAAIRPARPGSRWDRRFARR